MRNKKISEDDKKNILELYKNGDTYKDITEKLGFCSATLVKLLKGKRSASEAFKLAIIKGRRKLSDAARLSLSENGKKACIRSGKFWTKPERLFRDIILEIGIGVKYPDYIREIKKIEDDNLEKSFYYQYPIQRYVIDYVDMENKIAININGDYWHVNPLLYELNNLSKPQIINIRQDKNKRIFLEKNGWKVLDIWESEIYWNKELVKDKIRAVSLTAKPIVYTDKMGFQLPHCLPDWSETLRRLWFKKDRVARKKANQVVVVCGGCKKEFETTNKGLRTQKYCCRNCTYVGRRKVARPSKEELDALLKDSNIYSISKKYGVCWLSVKKWIKQYNRFSTVEVTSSNLVPLTTNKKENNK